MKVETIYSGAGVEIISSPFLVAEPLEKLAQAASEDWLRSLPREALLAGEGPVSLEILNGGHYYFGAKACEAVTGKPCRVATLRAKRGHCSAETYGGPANFDKNLPAGTEVWRNEGSDWCVRIWEAQPVPAGPVLVGDTIATGTTLAGVLGWLVSKMEAAGSVHDIYVFTIVGASDWCNGHAGSLKKLEPVDAALRKHGKELHVTFANGRFALHQNGTDMNPCPSMGSVLHERAKAELDSKVGSKFLKRMRCAIWDWGDRFRQPEKHLHEVRDHFRLQADCPQYILEGLGLADAPAAKKLRVSDS